MPKVNSKTQKGGNTKCQYELKPGHNSALAALLAMSAHVGTDERALTTPVPSDPEIGAAVDKFLAEAATPNGLPAGTKLQQIEVPTGAPAGTVVTYLPQQYMDVGSLIFDPATGDVKVPLATKDALVEAVKKAAIAAHAKAAPAPVAPLVDAAGPVVLPGGSMLGGKRKPAKKAPKKSSKKASKKSSKKASVKMVGGAKKKAGSKKAGSKKAGSKKAGSKKAGSKKAGSKKRAVKKN
jgi:hypothetical protein